MAECLGFQSHAHYAVAPLLAGHPDAARGVLREMAERTEDAAREENALARRFLPETRDAAMDAWAIPRRSPRFPAIPTPILPSLESSRAAPRVGSRVRDGSRSDGDAAWTPPPSFFFPLESTIRGVGALVSRVFGVTVEEEPLDDAEKWCDDAKKLTLRTRDGDLLGTVYLDLSRRLLQMHAAHFVVRCSRDAREGPASRKRPVVALVCNFGGGAGFSAGALLSHGEVETFLHEFGHAMHSYRRRNTNTRRGRRCAADLVEVPSHLFEYFAWDPTRFASYPANEPRANPCPRR